MFHKIIRNLAIGLVILCGLAFVFSSIYFEIQLQGELASKSISTLEHLRWSLVSLLWWHTVGAPFVFGLIFLGVGVRLTKIQSSSLQTRYLVFLLIASVSAIPFISFAAFVGTLVAAVTLILNALQKKHNKALHPTAESGG